MSVFLSRYLYFPLAEALKRTPVIRYLRDLESSQWQGDEELEGAVRGRLAQVLNAARGEVDYYRRRLSALGEITPATVLDALRRTPVLTRAEVCLHREALCSRARVERGGKIRYFRSEIGARPRSTLLAPDTPIYVGDPS